MKICYVKKDDNFDFSREDNIKTVSFGRVNIGSDDEPLFKKGIIVEYDGVPTDAQIRALENHFNNHIRVRVDEEDIENADDKRREAYRVAYTDDELHEALFEAITEDRPEKLLALQEKRNAIKLKYPKE